MILSNDKKNDALRLDEKQHVEEPLLAQLEEQGWTVIRLEQKQEPAGELPPAFWPGGAAAQAGRGVAQDQPVPARRSGGGGRPPHHHVPRPQPDREQPAGATVSAGEHHRRRQPRHGRDQPHRPLRGFQEPGEQLVHRHLAVQGAHPGTEHHIVPDIVLFLNGLPIGVIECKSPKVKEPIAEAIDQLLRYSQQRGRRAEGNAELFYYNQFLVATCRQQAKFGTITTHIEKHFFRWTDPYPLTLDDLPHEGTSPNDQQRLVAGMCSKDNLLDLIQSFTIFSTNAKGKTIKVVARYQQFRAVKLTVKRLLEGRNRRERSGIIWHTQGSGKSLTMMFMVREMRQHVDAGRLEGGLRHRPHATGGSACRNQPRHRPDREEWRTASPKLKDLIRNDSPDLVMAMMQKFQERDLAEIFPQLNPSPNILLMIDEAHRTQYKLLGANLDRAMPKPREWPTPARPLTRPSHLRRLHRQIHDAAVHRRMARRWRLSMKAAPTTPR